MVLAERDKEEMEMDIAKLEFDFMGTSVICRSGSPLILADLKKVLSVVLSFVISDVFHFSLIISDVDQFVLIRMKTCIGYSAGFSIKSTCHHCIGC